MHLRKRTGMSVTLMILGAVLGAVTPAFLAAQNNPNPNAPTRPAAPAQMKEDAANFQLVGFNDLQGRSSYQPTIHQQGNRWIAYVGTHGERFPSGYAHYYAENGFPPDASGSSVGSDVEKYKQVSA